MLQRKPLSLAVRAALGLTTAVISLPLMAQDRPSTADAFGLEEVVVTGSRIQKANLVTSSPVTQLDAEQLTLTGVTRIEDVLQAMPQVYLDQDSGQSIESDGTATLQLRNLGNSRTLVLLDGKRLPIASPTASESGADLNFIPMGLVKRVEILTGGASSTYGSDAVAGVVNFLLVDDFEGVKLDYQFARNRHDNSGNVTSEKSALRGFPVPEGSISDGDISDMTFIMGGNLNEGRGNVTAYATYRDIEAVTQSERDYSACALQSGASRCGGSGTSGPGTFYFDSDGFNQPYYTDGDQFAPGRVLFNFAPPSYFQRPDERYTLGAMAHYELNEHADAYTQLMFMDDRTVAQFAPAGMFFDDGVSINCDNPLLSAQQYTTMGCTGPDDDIGVYLGRRNVEGGPRFGDLRHTTYRGVFGLRGDITEGWRYDASFQYAEVDMRNTNGNYTDVAKMTDGLNAVQSGGQVVCESGNPGCVPWNVFQSGGVTSDQTAYFAQRYFERGTTDQTVATGYVQGSLGQYGLKLPWAENGVDVVMGVEWREENLDYLPDDASQRGDVGGLSAALVPVIGGYEVVDYFAEASIPLVEGKDYMQALTLELGYRYSDYDTDVTSDSYKYALSWSIDEQFKLRGSFQRAVRAANIVDMFQPQSGTLYSMTDDPCAEVGANGLSGRGYTFEQCARSGVSQAQWDVGGPSSSPAAQYNTLVGGSTELDPEESDTWSAGIILTPNFVDGLTVSLDWYDIDVQGAISTIAPETTLLLCIESSTGCEKVHRGVADSLWLGNASATNGIGQLSENIGYFRVKGIDIDAAYSVDLTSGWGSLNFSNILGYIDSWEQEEYEGAGAEECQGTYGGSCETPLAELRNRFTTTWATPWNVSLNLTWRYIDEVEQIQSSTPIDIDAYNYFDLAGTWNVTDYATVRMGVNNLMDEEPPITDNGATLRNNGNTYPGVYDHLGQYWFLGGSLQF